MKILVLSFWYPPTTSGGGIRAAKTVRHLRELGHEVVVLTAGGQHQEEGLIRTPWIRVNAPVDLLVGGKRAERLGYAQASQGFPLLGALGRTYRELFNFPDGAIGWVPYACAAGRRLLAQWRPDLILAASKPMSTLLAGRLLSRVEGIPWVAEMCDLWVDNHCYRYQGPRKWLERVMERYVLEGARALVTTSRPWAETLQRRYPGRPTEVVNHACDPEDFPTAGPPPGGPLTLLYAGTAYEGYQDPSPLFQAMREIAAPLQVLFRGRDLGWVRKLAQRHGVLDRVRMTGMIEHGPCLAEMRRSDVLLLMLWSDSRERGVHTYKLYDYLGARRPILALGPTGNVAADLILEQRTGVVAQSAEQVHRQLSEWLRQKQETGHIPEAAEVAAELTRRVQVEKLAHFLESLRS